MARGGSGIHGAGCGVRYIGRDILSLRLENRARMLRMLASQEAAMSRSELRQLLREQAEQLDDDARAVGRMERAKGKGT